MPVLVGAFVGPFALWAISWLYFAAFDSKGYAEGANLLVFIVALPFGSILGALAGLCLNYWRRGNRRDAAQIAIAGGVMMLMLNVSIVAILREDPVSALSSGWLAPTCLSSAALIIWGIQVLRRLSA